MYILNIIKIVPTGIPTLDTFISANILNTLEEIQLSGICYYL